MASGLNLKGCGQPLEVQRSLREDGLAVLTSEIPKELSMSYAGCLWLAIGYNDAHGHEGWVSFSRLEVIKVDEGASGSSKSTARNRPIGPLRRLLRDAGLGRFEAAAVSFAPAITACRS
jgi:hypothetical protein